jgi:sec-independent protein translocase protein TatB
MANLGMTEMLVIFVMVVVFVGPDDLPKMMKFLGRTYGKVRRASDELRRAFTLEVDKVDAEHRATEIRRRREELLARRRAEAEERRAASEGEPVARGDALVPESSAAEPPSEPSSEPVQPEQAQHTAAAKEVLETVEQRLNKQASAALDTAVGAAMGEDAS